MRIPLLYREEYSQWVERFMNYLEEQTDGEAMINSIKNDDQPLPRVTQVSIAETSSNEQPPLKDKSMWHMLGSEYGEQDRKAVVFVVIQKIIKKTVVVTSDPLDLIAEKTKVNKSKEKVVVSSDFEGSGADDFSELKKITALLVKAFNRRKFYSKATNNNLRTSSTSQSANKKQEFVKTDDKKEDKKVDEKKKDMSKVKCYNCKKEGHFAKDCKKAKVKDYNYYKTKMLLAKKDSNEQVLLAEDQALMESNLDTFSSVRRPKQSNVIWKKKGSSNTSNVDLSSVSHSKLNKDVKRYSHKDLLSCNNSHLGETSSAYVCNDAINVSCNSRLCDLFYENNLFIFDDESVRTSPVSKMPFRKKPRVSMNVRSKSNSNKSLPRTMHKWLPKMQLLAEPVAKRIPRIVLICLWIIDSRCSKHMMGNRALLTNFVEKFLGTVRFGNNDFAVIAGYGDVVGISQQFSAARTPQQNGVMERRNRTLVEAVENSNVEIPSHEEEVFHESYESFQGESSLSSLNDDVHKVQKK
nr:integrase, catalytic region, zinc finger, CCHC-type, peptidase aspartic, catalytic [Tanacetum cinerariifolium]